MPASTSDPSLEGLPRQLGKYTLLRRIASGGMAELFLAIQRSVGGFEKLIAIKRILPSMTQDPGFIEMFLHEARIAASLSHPNIVQVFDVGVADGAYFIAMEHVHGEDLRSVVRQMKNRGAIEFPMEHALTIVQAVCAGLAYAHEKRDLDGTPLDIVHRDVSPQNVVVTFSGDVKLVDFGIAKSIARSGEDTESGRLKGKVPYMSPEQARGEAVDARSDVFAAGVLLFELTTGRRLFKAASEYETLKLICDRDYPLPSTVRRAYPPGLEAIVMRALAKDRAARWQSAHEMQVALEELIRVERIGASRVSLSLFMRSLFEDKLASHSEELLQGKQLADRLGPDGEAREAAPGAVESARISSLGPTAAPTVTEARATASGATLYRSAAVVALSAAAALAVTWVRAPAGPARNAVPLALGSVAAGAGPARSVVPPPREHGVVAIASAPAGASIFVNGALRAEKTPATFNDLALGTPYVITLAAPGFVEASQTVSLTEGDPSAAVSVVLEREAARAKAGASDKR